MAAFRNFRKWFGWIARVTGPSKVYTASFPVATADARLSEYLGNCIHYIQDTQDNNDVVNSPRLCIRFFVFWPSATKSGRPFGVMSAACHRCHRTGPHSHHPPLTDPPPAGLTPLHYMVMWYGRAARPLRWRSVLVFRVVWMELGKLGKAQHSPNAIMWHNSFLLKGRFIPGSIELCAKLKIGYEQRNLKGENVLRGEQKDASARHLLWDMFQTLCLKKRTSGAT